MTQKLPLPLTPAMLAVANPYAGRPSYASARDWSQGATGNDIDIATRTAPVVSAASSATFTPYPIRTQTAKAAYMSPQSQVLGDLGKDRGEYSGQTGRQGHIHPREPYPDASMVPE